DQIKEMTRKVSAEVDLVHQQTQNQRYGSSHIGATAKDISNVVTDAASGVVDIFHGIDKAAMSKLFGGGQKAASGGIQGDVLATDNNTVGMGDAGIKSAIQGSNVPNPDEAVPSFVSGAMAKAGKGLLEGTLQA